MDLKPIASIETRGMCLTWCSSCIIWLIMTIINVHINMFQTCVWPCAQISPQCHLIAHNATIEDNLRVKGEPGMLDPIGESGTRPGSTIKFWRWPFLVTFSPEMWILNFLRPFSGAGPATVSSQSLCKNPITTIKVSKGFLFLFLL